MDRNVKTLIRVVAGPAAGALLIGFAISSGGCGGERIQMSDPTDAKRSFNSKYEGYSLPPGASKPKKRAKR